MTHPRNVPPAGAGAEKAAFLRDLRALRNQAGLGPRDLAARAHFPETTLTMAEAGPDLPSLPILQAYVRGCGAGEGDWEDRWRRLNANDGTDGSQALPTRAPSSSRQPARVMPFPVAGSGPAEPDQDSIGYGLARVARGLVPLSPDSANGAPDLPTRTPFGAASAGNGSTRPSAEFSDFSASGSGTDRAGGWFDPTPKDAEPPALPYTPPPAPPSPPVSPAAATEQYPAMGGYQTPGYQAPGYQAPERSDQPPPSSYSAPSYRLPEEFSTPAPEPPDLAGSARPATGGPAAPGGYGASVPGPGATMPNIGSPPPPPSAAGHPAPSRLGAPSSPGASAVTPKPHAAPGKPQRRTSGWVVAAVIIVLIITAVIWLVLSH